MATNIEEIAEKLDTLTLLEASQLSKLLQEKWGVSAAAAVAVAAPAAGGAAAGGAAAEPVVPPGAGSFLPQPSAAHSAPTLASRYPVFLMSMVISRSAVQVSGRKSLPSEAGM